MYGTIGRPIPGITGCQQYEGKRVLEELFCAAWTVRVGSLVAGTSPAKSSSVTASELKQMSSIIDTLRSQTPSLGQLYAEMGVHSGATAQELKKAYMSQARAVHPDKNIGDARATERFQRLSEVYDVLSSSERQREYVRGSPIHIPGCPHPHQLLEAEFGSASALEPLLGSLLFAKPIDTSKLSPRASGDAAFKSQHNTRVQFLRLRLEAELCAWKGGDRNGVLTRARSHAVAVARTLGGARLLLATGRAYVDKAEMALGRKTIFGLPAAFKATAYYARRVISGAASAGPCWAVLRHFGEVSARLRMLHSKTSTDERAQRAMLRLVGSSVEMLRRLTLIEIEGVLDEVLSGVLDGRGKELVGMKAKLFEEEVPSRAEGVREMGRIFIKVAKDAIASHKTERKKK